MGKFLPSPGMEDELTSARPACAGGWRQGHQGGMAWAGNEQPQTCPVQRVMHTPPCMTFSVVSAGFSLSRVTER